MWRRERQQAALLAQEGHAGTQFVFSWEHECCGKCRRTLQVWRTRRRTVLSLFYGKFVAREREGYCPHHPKLPAARSKKLLQIVAPGCNLAYDLLVYVGMARFLECRQCEEIQVELSRQHGIEVPLRTVSDVAHKFVAYVEAVHRESTQLLRSQMRERGGYILHVDGTCEEGSRVLLVCLDSLSAQVLESRKIGSESHDEVEQVLQDVRGDWGVPLAIVHDLRQSLITAAAQVFPGTRQFVCHYHFAADVGKDILSVHVDRLRRVFRRTKVRPKLRALCRSLKQFAVDERGTAMIASILDATSITKLREASTPEVVQGTVHALASWILAFSRTGDGYGFPFDMPYLTFYDRVRAVHKVLSEIDADWSVKKRGPLGTLKRLKQILDVVVVGKFADEFHSIVVETRRDQAIFERLRSALRICPKGGIKRRSDDGASSTLSAARHRTVLMNLRQSLKRKSRNQKPPQACSIVVTHLDKYSHLLFGHVIRKRSGKIIVPRTNNVEESLFRTVKRQCRRLHGRGHLAHDMDNMSEGTPLLLNLRNPSYCETVYGGSEPQRIAERFSLVAPQAPRQLLERWRREKLSLRLPRKFESLPNLPQRLYRFIRIAFNSLPK